MQFSSSDSDSFLWEYVSHAVGDWRELAPDQLNAAAHVLEKSFAKILRTLRDRAKGIAPIHMLPDNLILEIVRAFASSHWNDARRREEPHTSVWRMPPAVVLSHVCRRWRRAVMAAPSLWSETSLALRKETPTAAAVLLLRTSGPLDIRIFQVCGDHASLDRALATVLAPHARRVRSLHLHMSPERAEHLVTSIGWPVLQEITVGHECRDCKGPTGNNFPWQSFHAASPRLVRVSVIGTSAADTKFFASLATIRSISITAHSFPFACFLEHVVGSCTKLEELTFDIETEDIKCVCLENKAAGECQHSYRDCPDSRDNSLKTKCLSVLWDRLHLNSLTIHRLPDAFLSLILMHPQTEKIPHIFFAFLASMTSPRFPVETSQAVQTFFSTTGGSTFCTCPSPNTLEMEDDNACTRTVSFDLSAPLFLPNVPKFISPLFLTTLTWDFASEPWVALLTAVAHALPLLESLTLLLPPAAGAAPRCPSPLRCPSLRAVTFKSPENATRPPPPAEGALITGDHGVRSATVFLDFMDAALDGVEYPLDVIHVEGIAFAKTRSTRALAGRARWYVACDAL